MAKAIDRRSNATNGLLDEISAQLVEFPGAIAVAPG